MKTIKPLFGIITVTVTLAIQANAQSFPTNGLVAYYPFNGNANDATGNGNNGQIVGNVILATDRFGNPSNAYHFDGTNGVIEVTNPIFNIGEAGYTVSGWFCSDDVTKVQQAIFNTSPETGIALELNSAVVPNYLMVGIGPANAYWTVIQTHGTKTNYANQMWYQVVFTKNGAAYTAYIDGQMDYQETVSQANNYDYNVGCFFGGIEPTGMDEIFEGRLNDFRIYNRALSSNEVQQLYAYESVPPCSLPYPATAAATVTNGFVIGATVTDGGCGYTNTPLVLILGGGGTGTTATAVVSNGMVVGITITDAGIGYTSTPTIYIYSPLGAQIGILQAVIPTFSSLTIGSNYQLQASSDLITWTNEGTAFAATNPTMIYPQYFNVTGWNQLYFRLQAAP